MVQTTIKTTFAEMTEDTFGQLQKETLHHYVFQIINQCDFLQIKNLFDNLALWKHIDVEKLSFTKPTQIIWDKASMILIIFLR